MWTPKANRVVDMQQPQRDTNPKTASGRAKPQINLIPGTALVHMAEALRDGLEKYHEPMNWRTSPVSISTYINAAYRHLMALADGEEVDPATGIHHAAYLMTNGAIILDAMAQGTLIDDRQPAGKTADLIREKTRSIT